MLRASLVLVLITMLAGLSMAAEPELLLPGPGGNTADIDREVLWLDAPDFAGSTGSSEVIGAYDLWSEVASAFVLEISATIRKVTWWGAYWNYEGVPTGSGFNLRFYMTVVDCLPEDAPLLEYLLPGNDCCEALAEGGDMYSQYVYEYCFDLPLPPELYWFSAQMADHPFPPQWGRLCSGWHVPNCESMVRYYSNTEWEPLGAIIFESLWVSQMIEDVCEATPIENASWGTIKQLYRE